jgi:hypothetical protein
LNGKDDDIHCKYSQIEVEIIRMRMVTTGTKKSPGKFHSNAKGSTSIEQIVEDSFFFG